MSGSVGKQPEAMSEPISLSGETRDRWSWVEPRVWTERMLAALERGVTGGTWYSLIDKVYPEETLRLAFAAVAANRGASGVDHVTITTFARNLDGNLQRLSEDLRNGTYRPQAIRRHYIPKPGSPEMRPLGIPTIRADDPGSGGSNRAADGAGTDLRTGVCRAQLRFSSRSRM